MFWFGKFICIIFFGGSFWNRKRSPLFTAQQFSNKYDLPDVVRIMSKLPAYCFNNRVAHIPNVNFLLQVVFCQWIYCVKPRLCNRTSFRTGNQRYIALPRKQSQPKWRKKYRYRLAIKK